MTWKQEAFVNNFTDSTNRITYRNGTQSYMKGYNTNNRNVAQVEAYRLLRNPKIKSEIDQIIIDLNMDSKVRLKAVKEVITGKYQQTTITTTTDKEGNEYTAKSIKTPTARELITAVDLVERITGTYDKNKVKADAMSGELKSLIKAHRKELTG